jgi:hypothetical protein
LYQIVTLGEAHLRICGERFIIEDMLRTRYVVLTALVFIIAFGAIMFTATRLHEAKLDPALVNDEVPASEETLAFKTALEQMVAIKKGVRVEGLSPEDIMSVLPKVIPDDFNGVEGVLGQYTTVDGRLVFSNEETVDGAAGNITDTGYDTLRSNIYNRLDFDVSIDSKEVVKNLQADTDARSPSDIPPATEVGTICPKDAKICPDGSTVGREGLECEFKACPGENSSDTQTVMCQPEQRLVDVCTEQYQPVCAAYQVQCITTPCDPVPKTYSNSCFACMDNNVISYTNGACSGE